MCALLYINIDFYKVNPIILEMSFVWKVMFMVGTIFNVQIEEKITVMFVRDHLKPTVSRIITIIIMMYLYFVLLSRGLLIEWKKYWKLF